MSFDSCIPFSCNMTFCFVIDCLKYPLVICPALRTPSASFSMRRDSRDRSRTRDRRARQPFRKHSRSRRRSHSRPQLKRSPAHQQEDSSWKSSSTHYDTQSQYGLSFPRVVESTQWRRKAQIAGQSVNDVRLVDAMYGGLQNWALRLIANGRFSAVEVFRSRMESMVASTLFKEMWSQKDDIDLVKVLKHFTPANSNPEDFSVKQQAVKDLCTNIVEHLKQFMPVDQNQTMLQELEEGSDKKTKLCELPRRVLLPPQPPFLVCFR